MQSSNGSDRLGCEFEFCGFSAFVFLDFCVSMLNFKKSSPASSSRDLVWTDKWPFQSLDDLHLGNQKVTLKKLGDVCRLLGKGY